jgi:hypothetical protein
MGRALFGELLRHVKGKNVQSIVLETTDESRDYWERMGFKVQSSYGTVRRYHSLDFPLDLMVEKMEGGS